MVSYFICPTGLSFPYDRHLLDATQCICISFKLGFGSWLPCEEEGFDDFVFI